MAEPRKVFRIEQMPAAQLEAATEGAQSGLRHGEIMRELRALHAALVASRYPVADAAPDRGEIARLVSELNSIAAAIKSSGQSRGQSRKARDSAGDDASMSRIDDELNAVISSAERATQKILAAAEEIESAANNLSAALDGRIEQQLAQDIQDLVVQVFEACNFQDLVGQRVAKVLAAVKFIEEHIVRVLEDIQNASVVATLHGPRLETDRGHASQDDIDALFAAERMGNGGS